MGDYDGGGGGQARSVILLVGLSYYLIHKGELIRTIWLCGCLLDSFRALRTIRSNGRAVGLMTRRKAMREALRGWIVYILLGYSIPIVERLFSWIPLYGPLSTTLSLALVSTRSATSNMMYNSFIRGTVKKYEKPVDLTLSLIRSIWGLAALYLVEEPMMAARAVLGPLTGWSSTKAESRHVAQGDVNGDTVGSDGQALTGRIGQNLRINGSTFSHRTTDGPSGGHSDSLERHALGPRPEHSATQKSTISQLPPESLILPPSPDDLLEPTHQDTSVGTKLSSAVAPDLGPASDAHDLTKIAVRKHRPISTQTSTITGAEAPSEARLTVPMTNSHVERGLASSSSTRKLPRVLPRNIVRARTDLAQSDDKSARNMKALPLNRKLDHVTPKDITVVNTSRKTNTSGAPVNRPRQLSRVDQSRNSHPADPATSNLAHVSPRKRVRPRQDIYSGLESKRKRVEPDDVTNFAEKKASSKGNAAGQTDRLSKRVTVYKDP
ncbi:hypothetical protein BD324DRAFT_609674 [Kockovaella imperatae]|uniref:Uncharacterized protein n=1 Tax=Kockovaella imperatae TaxID=4999 RepID=A0A1Y1UBK8_9TREE|nr:hypothetical protein BD324DRAFT_609674 [Kockovaella imperatae]ORX34907.1 hypothetical protein BD324DRAFT_609674 [Kockovaella imperatae]